MIPLQGNAPEAVRFLDDHWPKPPAPSIGDIPESSIGMKVMTPTGYSYGGAEVYFVQRFSVERDAVTGDRVALSVLYEHYAVKTGEPIAHA
jgi:hypothetical protein